MNISKIAVVHTGEIIRTFDIEPKPLDRIVDAYFRRHRELNASVRREIADLVFNVIRWWLRIEDALIRQGVKKPTREQIVAYYLDNAPFEISDTPPKSSPFAVAAYYSMPQWLAKRFIKQQCKEDACHLMAALKTEAPVALRTNILKTSREELLGMLRRAGHDVQATLHSPYGITMNKRTSLATDESFKQGFFDIQDEASQLAAMAVGVQPGEVILDACAGAGGKALMLAMMMGDEGTIIAADIDPRKLKEIEKRAQRAGAASIIVLPTKDLERMKKYRGQCDAVLLDVPCSGTGTLRRAPDLAARLREKDVALYAEQQRALLREYTQWLKPRGRLIYSTCSVLQEENEAIVEEFMKDRQFESAGKKWMVEAGIDERFITPEGYFKALPSRSSMDGFFACVMMAAVTRH
jgi:16S rRNA (cytosine967-C5)-methyltransferase